MKIVVLDGYTMNQGDLDWSLLRQLGPCEIHDRTPDDLILERAAGAEILLTNKTVLSAEIIKQLPGLRYIGVLATGYNVVDTTAAAEQNIVVSNIPGYSTASVAQMVFALLLEMTQQVAHHDRLVREGRWAACVDFSFCDKTLLELEGRTFGIVGCGQIGRRVTEIAKAFGMRVMAATANPEKHRDWAEKQHVELVDQESLFSGSDIISLHCPLTPETDQLVNADRLKRMKPGAILINTGRGQLVDEVAVTAALKNGQLGGFGSDVLASEPPAADNPLFSTPNSFITPHIGWATREARDRQYAITLENIRAFLAGTPQNRVN